MRYIELEAGRAGQVLDAWRAEMPLAGVLALLAEADKDNFKRQLGKKVELFLQNAEDTTRA